MDNLMRFYKHLKIKALTTNTGLRIDNLHFILTLKGHILSAYKSRLQYTELQSAFSRSRTQNLQQEKSGTSVTLKAIIGDSRWKRKKTNTNIPIYKRFTKWLPIFLLKVRPKAAPKAPPNIVAGNKTNRWDENCSPIILSATS